MSAHMVARAALNVAPRLDLKCKDKWSANAENNIHYSVIHPNKQNANH